MSRIGRQPVVVPAGVKVSVESGVVKVEGAKGQKLELPHHPNMKVDYDKTKNVITVTRPNDERQNRSLHGLTRTLIANMVEGVTKGYKKILKVEGIGYQARMDGKNTIVLTVGFANPIKLSPPEGVIVEVEKDSVTINVSGYDKQKVGQFAAEIREKRKPEPYKGKGIRYINEVPRRKEGKSFASGG